jgi:glucose-1-phosphate adenylyltransferase
MSANPSEVMGVVLGGGKGERLFPLTKLRSKPAVPLAGNYRLVDIPLSNGINSNVRKLFVLTQFNSASLNRHVAQTYWFDKFTGGFVNVLAAEQTLENQLVSRDCRPVRQSVRHFADIDVSLVLGLSGDQLCRWTTKDPAIPCGEQSGYYRSTIRRCGSSPVLAS